MAINSGAPIEANDIKEVFQKVNLRTYFTSSEDTNKLVFSGVELGYRLAGILAVNANGQPGLHICSLFSRGAANDCSISAEGWSISGVDTTEQTGYTSAEVTITGVPKWTYGWLCVTQSPV